MDDIQRDGTPLGYEMTVRPHPRVAAARQPWAMRCNRFAVNPTLDLDEELSELARFDAVPAEVDGGSVPRRAMPAGCTRRLRL